MRLVDLGAPVAKNSFEKMIMMNVNRFLSFALSFVFVFVLSMSSVQMVAQSLPVSRHRHVVIAHRGDHVSLPENTLLAYKQGIDDGADYVEVDLRTTRDSFLVVMHNETVDRMTNGRGAIRDFDYAAIRGLVIWDAVHNQATRIPSFEEVLALCRNKINIYLDFKEADPGVTYAMIKKAGMEKHVAVYANSLEQITEWGKVAPAMPVITSIPDELKDSAAVAAFLDRYPIVGVDGSIGQYSPAIYRLFAQRHIAVWLDVQQKDEGPATWEKALAEKVPGMQSDHPAALVAYLKQKGIR